MIKKILLVATLIITIGCQAQENKNFEVAKNLDIFNSLYEELDMYYVDTLDANVNIKNAIDYMLSRLDPYTTYYSKEDAEELKQMTTGKYAGIGAIIHYSKERDCCAIAEPFKDSPSDKAGLISGDVILKVDGKEMGKKGEKEIDDYTSNVSKNLRGKPGTTLNLVIQRPGEKDTRTFNIVRDNIQQPAITCTKLLPNNVGYISLTQFTVNCARDLRRSLVELKKQGATKLILDLRNNPGGLLSEAVEIVNFFIPKNKVVVSTKGKIEEENDVFKTTNEPLDLIMPIVILVNENTASAAEITSGALQDYDRAVVLGALTYGKGLVQQPRELPYKSILKLTTSKYYMPSGRCIQKYDYKHRNSDGSAKNLNDSLVKIFYTAAGRPVNEKGGVTPDVKIEQDSLPPMLAYLQLSEELFNYANRYHAQHKTIEKPEDFDVTDKEYVDFIDYMQNSSFKYDRQSLKNLETLQKIANFEGYGDTTKDEFAALKKKLSPDLSSDLKNWENKVRYLLDAEIIRRYYYREGLHIFSLKGDKFIEKAISLLKNTKEYNDLLEPTKK